MRSCYGCPGCAAGSVTMRCCTGRAWRWGPGLLGDVLADRRLLTLRIRRSRSLPAGRVRALLAGEVRTARNGRAGGVLLVAVLGVYAATVIIPPRWLPVVVLLCVVPAVSRLGRGSGGSASHRRCGGCSVAPTAP